MPRAQTMLARAMPALDHPWRKMKTRSLRLLRTRRRNLRRWLWSSKKRCRMGAMGMTTKVNRMDKRLFLRRRTTMLRRKNPRKESQLVAGNRPPRPRIQLQAMVMEMLQLPRKRGAEKRGRLMAFPRMMPKGAKTSHQDRRKQNQMTRRVVEEVEVRMNENRLQVVANAAVVPEEAVGAGELVSGSSSRRRRLNSNVFLHLPIIEEEVGVVVEGEMMREGEIGDEIIEEMIADQEAETGDVITEETMDLVAMVEDALRAAVGGDEDRLKHMLGCYFVLFSKAMIL
mmetsp:Transcript_23668/g.48980  ORF Transcript_23668/g.48980 Transcript_23668/m.48980 type:complete len:285 (-) Transcript_23668:962-1816(-)